MFFQKKYKTSLLALLCFGQIAAQSEHYTLRQGERHYDRGEYEKAQKAYQKSKSSTALYNAGNAAYLQSDHTEAAQLFREAAEKALSPTEKADALYNLGNACMLTGDYRAAIDAYERSLRLVPKRPDAQKNLQIAKRKLHEPPPETPPPPPPPPPPPSVRPRHHYLDQADPLRQKEIPPSSLPPDAARRLLNEAVLSEEQKNAGVYRELAPANRPSRLKKDW
ncbi:MAG: tetratricopeptide repeat protein [Saprospiraceae bacterium]